jgi:tRNA G10  N-methylase Trm11
MVKLGLLFDKQYSDLAKWEIERNLSHYRIVTLSDTFVILEIPKLNLNKILEFKTYPFGAVERIVSLYSIDSYTDLVNEIANSFYVDSIEISWILRNINIEEVNNLSKAFLKKLKSVFKKIESKSLAREFTLGELSKRTNIIETCFLKTNSTFYIGRTLGAVDPYYFKFLDESRPSRVFTHGTAPRLAKILVNLLKRKGGIIVDPFCGSGTILLELLRQGYDVIGIDNDPTLLEASKKNILHLAKNTSIKSNYTLINESSEYAKFRANGAVFEPFMGPFLKNIPSVKIAKKISNNLNILYENVFRNLYDNLSKASEVICILPSIPSTKEVIKLDFDLFFKDKFKISNSKLLAANPIVYESRTGNKLKRRIFILEKV